MINLLTAAKAKAGLPPIMREATNHVGSFLTTVLADLVRMYRMGGLLGVLAGVLVSTVLSQARRLDR